MAGCVRGLLQVVLVIAAFHQSESTRRQTKLVQARVNEDVTLKCVLKQENEASFVQWTKYGVEVKQDSDIRTKKDELRITNLRRDDQGIYSCRGIGGYGAQPWYNFTLIVYDSDVVSFPANAVLDTVTERPNMGPRFMMNPPGQRDLEFNAGSSPKLKCRVESNPHASIDWTKNGYPLDHSRERLVIENYSLKLLNIQAKDEGQYTCKVYNGYGSVNFTYIITVTDPSMPTAKVIPPYPLNTSVAFGSAASLQCKVRSNSRPTIMWLKQTNKKEPGTIEIQHKLYKLIKNETMLIETEEGAFLNKLVIQNVQEEDAGMYVCLGLNQGGGSDKREALLSVRPAVMATSTALAAPTDSSWEFFGSPSATLAVLIAIPVVIILIVTIAVIYGLNKRKKSKRGIRRPPSNMNEHEVAVPLNMNANNGCYTGQYTSRGSTGSYTKGQLPSSDPRYTPDKLHKPQSHRNGAPQQYSQYFQSDGSYRSSLHYPALAHPHQHNYVQDIPDSDSHFSSVSHTKPQYMNTSRNPYDDRDIHSDPAASRTGGHHCPPPPPGSYYSEQW